MGMMGGMPNWGSPPYGFTCPECGEPAYFTGIQCRECSHVFSSFDEQGNRIGDKCPECGYSRAEERKKEQREEKQQKRDKKKARRDSKRNK